MTEKPELSDGHARIANEIMEVLARTYMSSYESQFVWCLFRKTYGWNKKEDWVSLSQIAEATGMHRSHASRTKQKLITRRIVTQTGNKLAFNKYWSQWTELPKQVTVTQTGNKMAPDGTHLGNRGVPIQVFQGVPKQVPTKDSITKDILQKTVPEIKMTDDQLRSTEEKFMALAASIMDEHYAAKTWDQGLQLPAEYRNIFFKKVTVMLGSKREGFQRVVLNEIAGLVNDKGAMMNKLSPAEKESRQEFTSDIAEESF